MPRVFMGTAPIPLIMTRPVEANTRFVAQLPTSLSKRLKVIESPLVEIVPESADFEIGPGEAVIFTSANGVQHAPDGQGRQAFCVGQRTREAACAAGWDGAFCGQTADALVSSVLAAAPAVRLWHLAGRHTRGQIAERLTAGGLQVTRVTVYDQALRPLTAQAKSLLKQGKTVIVPIFSPRTATQFVQEYPAGARPHIVALSDAVAAPMGQLGCASLEVAPAPDAQAVVKCLEKLVARISLG
ncbi:uroporphyrinogen-III synthase [uncultured Roseobacter sp.]|uniref:uroporphyrinogen-III synthase n=1 Tax=uncultured Roseobacter sp. TaxID=114847 RepID=UPI00260ED53E|nr:uroporphyrinogen-III synthase [uncultured Roseobacter sp.]